MKKSVECGKLDPTGSPGRPCGACEYCEFAKVMLAFKTMFPNASWEEATIPSWWSQLKHLELDDVRNGFRRGVKNADKFMPTLPEVMKWADLAARERLNTKPLQTRLLPGDIEPARGLPANHPAMILAREWEEESRRLGLDPDKPSPRDIAKRRMAQIQELLGMRLELSAEMSR